MKNTSHRCQPILIFLLGLVWFAHPTAAFAEASVERVAFLEDGRVIALIRSPESALSQEGMEVVHDGQKVERYVLEPQEEGSYRLMYRAPTRRGNGIHHELVIGAKEFARTQPMTLELIEGKEIQPFGLDTRGHFVRRQSFLERLFPLLLAIFGLALGTAAFRIWQNSKQKSLKRCTNCGEQIEAGFSICVYCTFPGIVGKPTGKGLDDKTAKTLKRVLYQGDVLDEHHEEEKPTRPTTTRQIPPEPASEHGGLFPELESLTETAPATTGLQDTILLQRAPSLQIVEGPDQGRRFPLVTNEILIGSSQEGDIILRDPSIEPLHARILNRGGHFELEDTSHGRNLKLNGKRLRQSRLQVSDRIRLGTTTLLFLPE